MAKMRSVVSPLIEVNDYKDFFFRIKSIYGKYKDFAESLGSIGTTTDSETSNGVSSFYEIASKRAVPEIELNLLSSSYNADNYFKSSTGVSTFINSTPLRSLFTSLNNHFKNVPDQSDKDIFNANKTLDGFLEQNNIVYNNEDNIMYYNITGNYFNCVNVNCPDEKTMFTIEYKNIGEEEPTNEWVSTKGENMYASTRTSYSKTQKATNGNYAPTAVKLTFTKGPESSVVYSVQINGKDKDNKDINETFDTTSETEFTSSNKYVQIDSIVATPTLEGTPTVGDKFVIKNVVNS